MKKLTNAFIYTASIIILIGATSAQMFSYGHSPNNKIEVFEVDAQRAYCSGIVPKHCLQIKRERSKEFRKMYDEIENFRFIPGYRYVLKVEVEKMEAAPKDTSGYKYYLKEIVSRTKVSEDNPDLQLYLHRWELTQINGEDFEGRKPYILFDKNDGSFGGYSGCNSMGGKFEIEGKAILLSNIIQTKRACANMQEVEFPFTRNLQAADSYKAEIDRLYLYKNGKIVLEFKPNLGN